MFGHILWIQLHKSGSTLSHCWSFLPGQGTVQDSCRMMFVSPSTEGSWSPHSSSSTRLPSCWLEPSDTKHDTFLKRRPSPHRAPWRNRTGAKHGLMYSLLPRLCRMNEKNPLSGIFISAHKPHFEFCFFFPEKKQLQNDDKLMLIVENRR